MRGRSRWAIERRTAVPETTDIQSLVERVRKGINDTYPEVLNDALAALDSLTAALERAERERDSFRDEYGWIAIANDRAEAAEARAQKAEAELKVWQLDDRRVQQMETQLEKAEAVVEAARYFVKNSSRASTSTQGEQLRDALTAYDEPPTERKGRVTNEQFYENGQWYTREVAYDEPPTKEAT